MIGNEPMRGHATTFQQRETNERLRDKFSTEGNQREDMRQLFIRGEPMRGHETIFQQRGTAGI